MFIPTLLASVFKTFLSKLAEVTPFGVPTRRFVVYGALTTITVVFLYHLGAEFRETFAINTESVTAFVENSGSLSWVVFAAVVALVVMSPLPSSALGLIGGYLFSPWLALLLIACGEIVGASINYCIGRYIIGSVATPERFPNAHAKIEKYKSYLTGKTVFLLGLVPAGTANVTGYTAGLIGMRYRTYIIAWSLGIMSLSALTTFLGHSAQQRNYVTSILLGVSITLFLLFGKKYMRWLTRRLQRLLM